jgi:hypothetical protein
LVLSSCLKSSLHWFLKSHWSSLLLCLQCIYRFSKRNIG